MVLVPAEPENDWAAAEQDCWQKPSTPEADVFLVRVSIPIWTSGNWHNHLNVDHRDLTSKTTHVDKHVEVNFKS
jgi:hypothetical protein